MYRDIQVLGFLKLWPKRLGSSWEVMLFGIKLHLGFMPGIIMETTRVLMNATRDEAAFSCLYT